MRILNKTNGQEGYLLSWSVRQSSSSTLYVPEPPFSGATYAIVERVSDHIVTVWPVSDQLEVVQGSSLQERSIPNDTAKEQEFRAYDGMFK